MHRFSIEHLAEPLSLVHSGDINKEPDSTENRGRGGGGGWMDGWSVVGI